jgi:mannose-6-phosphate isomerase-like protein (cupin superfamily)
MSEHADVEKFAYEPPAEVVEKKMHLRLGRTDALYSSMQVLPPGELGRLHSHRGTDGFWYVIAGRARFMGELDVHAEIGEGEGVIVPRGTRYRVQNIGDGNLEILHVSATSTGFDIATDYQEHLRPGSAAG